MLVEITERWDSSFGLVVDGEEIATAKTRADAEQKKLIIEFLAGEVKIKNEEVKA